MKVSSKTSRRGKSITFTAENKQDGKSLLNLVAALAGVPVPAECGIVCQAAKSDGIICPDDECDRANGDR